MLIGIYSDAHCRRTSSILPLYTNSGIYTVRLQMIVDTYEWMYGLFSDLHVDLIVNCGDTFDSNIIQSDELTAMSEALSKSYGTREIIISGNHEVLDSNGLFEACNIFKNGYTEVYNKPKKIDDMISVIPYCNTDLLTTDVLRSISNKIAFTHIDIKGSELRPDYVLPTGIEAELLAEYFDVVINGHIHTPETLKTTKSRIINIGSVTGLSFSDSPEYTPSVCVFNTDSGIISRYENPHTVLFRKIRVDTTFELAQFLKQCDSGHKYNHKYAMKILCPYAIRDNVRDILNESEDVIAHRIVTDSRHDGKVLVHKELHTDRDIKEEFYKFLEQEENIKYPVSEYKKVLSEV